MFLNFLIITISCYCLSATVEGLTIRELSNEDENVDESNSKSVTETSYRKSVARIKETPHRVPDHLQFVPTGFIYEDADDVIHVIDPPKHFEELKKIMQRQEQRQLGNLRPIALRKQRPKPKIIKTKLPAKPQGDSVTRKPFSDADLEIQESEHLPLEILASVRKTEKFLRKYKPKLPAVKQRLKTKKIQTVIWEKQQEEQQYQQGQDQRIQGIREQQTPNRRRFYKTRFRRDVGRNEYNHLKGEELLNHINDLIKNASFYLKQTENFEDLPETDQESTTLQGEILPKTSATPLPSSTLIENMVAKILENSVRATNVIMQQIKTQTNLTEVAEKCDYSKVTYSNHIKNLQNQIKCMQNFINDINLSKQEQNQKQQRQMQQQQQRQQQLKVPKTYGERLEARKAKDLKHKPFLVAQLAEDYIDDTAPTPLNSSLIYNDVMTTIRNMLEIQNLQSLEDAAARETTSWEDSLNDSSFTQDKSPEFVDFQNLQDYLDSIQAIVANLPKFNHKSLNLQEIERGSTSKYYFVNPQGSIYSLPQPIYKDQTTSAPTTIFRQFPDLPIVTQYLRNGTLLPPSTKVVEIL